ncbi:Bug family tripartite tricarboxylate transporter substrate binding protein [Bradyrhizobium sp. CCGE-LA001]|uniref:Bug family tripartite tricarboxylate transporter substrate binding protein n=1 Tax=Bradyrhizobium sp. CCGE-LA001 TaxID=1223566 RepID=UPI0002AAB9F1|nr:tripartite tricarboxylate transporter substrate binding protein [Bradyrhizobium sp. CCGE-LA001]AMA57804.1 MFS transporter [Bradyrhizobium sp. CCGE-LA001]
MTIARRRLLQLAASVAALPLVVSPVRAETYPARPIRLIVPQAAGGASDISARLIGQWLSDRLGQPCLIENRPGAGGNIGTEAVVTAAPDGYTLLLVGSFNTINATLYDKLSFNFIRDIAPVGGVMRNPLVMAVHPSLSARTVPELIAYAKANPGKLNFGSAGNGSPQHMAAELFKMMTGIEMMHVRYRGSAALLTDLVRGEIQLAFDPIFSSLEHVKSGTLRALAVTTATRAPALPDIPAVGEVVPGYESVGWVGIGVPRDTPAQIVDKLNAEINAGLADAAIKARLTELGGAPLPGSPDELGRLIAEQTERWGKVIRTAQIRAE